GLKGVRGILKGEGRPGEVLALCDEQKQKKKSSAVKESLRGCWKKEQLFALRQALELWETYQQKIADCDREIESLLQQLAGPQGPQGGNAIVGPVKLAPAKMLGKNAPVIERCQELLARKLAQLFYRLLRYGADYVEKGLKVYEAKVLETEARLLRKLAKKQGFTLVPSSLN